ncbi:hypothetical protein GE09DRAFT_1034348 [Coniochaeta sp. 2T2.1]|nr:hypothetical protein GE09DRAFT_1034348 [Coniochaeta sp. 2T2.1]
MFIFSLLIQSILLLLAGLPLAQPHGVMNKPRPYNYATQPLLQVNPLSGLDFPCQGKFKAEEVTPVTAGENIFVNFTIGTDHHGGSCQFSVTYDDPASADKSKWKAIYSIIGGCPASSSKAYNVNLPFPYNDGYGRVAIKNCADASDNQIDCIRQFYIPFSKEMPKGNGTFAWTWFNNMGKPEMYMNCAPIFITNGAEDNTFYNQLPQMFVANIQGACQTNQGILYFPEPGKYGKVLQDTQTSIWYPSTIACGGTSSSPAFETGYPGTMTTVHPSGASSDSVASTSHSVSTSTSTSTSSSPSLSTSLTSVDLSTTTTGTSTSTITASIGQASTEPSSSTPPPRPGRISCSETEGTLICFDDGTMGTCSHGYVHQLRPAAGIICSDGAYVRIPTSTGGSGTSASVSTSGNSASHGSTSTPKAGSGTVSPNHGPTSSSGSSSGCSGSNSLKARDETNISRGTPTKLATDILTFGLHRFPSSLGPKVTANSRHRPMTSSES